MSNQICFWLMPAADEAPLWQEKVNTAADRYSGPSFAAHVTAYVAPLTARDDVQSLTDNIAAQFTPITLRAEGLEFSDLFTQCWIVRYRPDPDLSAMCEALQSLCAAPTDYKVNPHLSIFYGKLTEAQREEIKAEFTFPETLTLDRIWTIEGPKGVASALDVESWRVRCERPLSKG